jgi:glycosyltransferase involved in cell wall biosynthesis
MTRSAKPTVSIVLPTLNEREFIYDCLASLVDQDYAKVVEILVVDGGSTDGTLELAATFKEPVTVVHNPRVTAAAAMNTGVHAAVGDIICRADAHAVYSPDYVRRCVEALRRTGAANVGGRMRAVGRNAFGRAVAAVTSSPIGVGPGRFHYAETEQDVDTVYLGCWERQGLLDAGGFDETRLQWAAEDQELNYRLRQRGGRVVLDPSISSWYFPRETPRALWRQYGNYGVAKASTLVKHGSLPTWRPVAPAALVLIPALLAIRRRTRKLAPIVPVAHAVVAASAAVSMAGHDGVDLVRAFAAVEICHWSYGLGFCRGMLRALRGRPFDSRPRGHR